MKLTKIIGTNGWIEESCSNAGNEIHFCVGSIDDIEALRGLEGGLYTDDQLTTDEYNNINNTLKNERYQTRSQMQTDFIGRVYQANHPNENCGGYNLFYVFSW